MNQLSGSGRPPVSDVNIAICPPEQAEQIRLAENVLGTPPNRGYNHLTALQKQPRKEVETKLTKISVREDGKKKVLKSGYCPKVSLAKK